MVRRPTRRARPDTVTGTHRARSGSAQRRLAGDHDTSARRSPREHGFTLIEVMVTSALMLVVLAIVLPQLSSSITNFDNARVRSDTSDAAQLALDQIQHDVVSSNVLYQDGSGILHLQVYGGSPVASSTTVVTTVPSSICVEYQVAGDALQRRTKAPTAGIVAGGAPIYTGSWYNVMQGIVNSGQAGNPAVFSVNTNRSLDVNLWVNADKRTTNAAKPSQFTSTFTGRAIPSNPSYQGNGVAC
jgi:prepilin-type N-terminal cleavage/methylation domain-containing protein